MLSRVGRMLEWASHTTRLVAGCIHIRCCKEDCRSESPESRLWLSQRSNGANIHPYPHGLGWSVILGHQLFVAANILSDPGLSRLPSAAHNFCIVNACHGYRNYVILLNRRLEDDAIMR